MQPTILHQSWFTLARPSTPLSARLDFGSEHGGKFLRRDSSNDCKPQVKSCHSGRTTEVWCAEMKGRFSIPIPERLPHDRRFFCCNLGPHFYTGVNSIPHYPTQAEPSGSAHSFAAESVCHPEQSECRAQRHSRSRRIPASCQRTSQHCSSSLAMQAHVERSAVPIHFTNTSATSFRIDPDNTSVSAQYSYDL